MAKNRTNRMNLREQIEDFYTSNCNWQPIPVGMYASDNVAYSTYKVAISRAKLSKEVLIYRLYNGLYMIREAKAITAKEEIKKYLHDKILSSSELIDQLNRPNYITQRECLEHNRDVKNGTISKTVQVSEPKIEPCTYNGIYMISESEKVSEIIVNDTIEMEDVLIVVDNSIDNLIDDIEERVNRSLKDSGCVLLSEIFEELNLTVTRKDLRLAGLLYDGKRYFDTFEIEKPTALGINDLLLIRIRYRPNIVECFKRSAN